MQSMAARVSIVVKLLMAGRKLSTIHLTTRSNSVAVVRELVASLTVHTITMRVTEDSLWDLNLRPFLETD